MRHFFSVSFWLCTERCLIFLTGICCLSLNCHANKLRDIADGGDRSSAAGSRPEKCPAADFLFFLRCSLYGEFFFFNNLSAEQGFCKICQSVVPKKVWEKGVEFGERKMIFPENVFFPYPAPQTLFTDLCREQSQIKKQNFR